MPAIAERAPLLANGHADIENAEPLLRVEGLCAPVLGDSGTPLWSGVCFSVRRGQVLALRGPTGCGKTVMLKCIAQLLVHPSPADAVRLEGRSSADVPGGMPGWRAQVLYVPQRPAMLPGTPEDFLEAVQALKSRKNAPRMSREELAELTGRWHLNESCWTQAWLTLSGGEAQRISLLIALSLKPRVLLLDEPTSALDDATCLLVEKTILDTARSTDMACIWITHSDQQCDRVADDVYHVLRS